MKTTKHTRRLAKLMFRACHPDGVLDESRAQTAVQAVIDAKERDCLAILSYFQHLIKMERAQRTAQIESATPLPPEFQASLQTDLTRVYGQGLSFSFVHKPALLGGLRIKVGSDVYDGSIQSRLAAMEESF